MKHIISSLVVLAGGMTLCSASAATVTDKKDFSNSAVYNLNRSAAATDGGGLLHAVDGSTVVNVAASAKIDRESGAADWSIHYSDSEQTFYVYNLKTGQFLTGNNKNKAILSDKAVDCVPHYLDNVRYWMLDCGGYVIGLDASYKNKALFADGITREQARSDYKSFYTISTVDGKTVSDDVIAAIEAKIQESRASKIEEYKAFVTMAEGISSNEYTVNYLGLYELDALKYALDHVADYSVARLEEIYQQTLLSRYPKDGVYYRLHNRTRPAVYHKNQLSATTDGRIVSHELSTPSFGTAAEGYTDDLGLVRFWPVNGDRTVVKIQIPSIGKFLTRAGNNGRPGLTDSYSDAYNFTMQTVRENLRYYRFAQPDADNWLTISGSGELVGYGTAENAMQFFIEPVSTISVPVDANGYATVCVPCGVDLPDGCKAYTVTDFTAGKAYVEELESTIPLNTPFIVKAPAGAATVDLIVRNTTAWVATAMTGNVAVNTQAPGRYVPAFSADGIKFVYETSATALPGTAYLVSEDLGEVTTVMGANPEAGIDEITVGEAAATELFDLQGRRVSGTPRPGIYINAASKRPVRVN